MNRVLSEADLDRYLVFLDRALVLARTAIWANDANKAADIVDMLHNLPAFLRGSDEPWFARWSKREYFQHFVEPMRQKYPDLAIDWAVVPRE